MIKFIIKGLIRDSSRSLFPIIMVALSVAIVVLGQAYVDGAMGDIVEVNARFEAGHLKIMTKAYQNNAALKPNDLALTETTNLIADLRRDIPGYSWHRRIKFGGILDIPDDNGETNESGIFQGIAANIIGNDRAGIDNLSLRTSIVRGRVPSKSGEILISDQFFESLKIDLNDQATIIGSGMDGGTAVANFTVVGTVTFGVSGLDRGALIADISDIQFALQMTDAASEILGFRPSGFDQTSAETALQNFNAKHLDSDDRYAPIMISIRDQGGFGEYIDLGNYMGGIMVVVFVFIITLVLWNSGIRGGIRRYSEFGLRLALGESAGHVYSSQLVEAFVIGVIGSILGTAIGLAPSYYLQEVGFDVSQMLDSSTSGILMQDIIRAKITTTTLWIGLIPGILATQAGALISGLGIYGRSTASLFKELEI